MFGENLYMYIKPSWHIHVDVLIHNSLWVDWYDINGYDYHRINVLKNNDW